MAIRISTNAGAVAANYHLGVNSTKLERSMARLASGQRINRPSDDARGTGGINEVKVCDQSFKRSGTEHSKRDIVFGSTGRNPRIDR